MASLLSIATTTTASIALFRTPNFSKPTPFITKIRCIGWDPEGVLGPPQTGHLARREFKRRLEKDAEAREAFQRQVREEKDRRRALRQSRVAPDTPTELIEYFLDTEAQEIEFEISRLRPRLNEEFFSHLRFEIGQLRFAVSKTEDMEDRLIELEALQKALQEGTEAYDKMQAELIKAKESLTKILSSKDVKTTLLEMVERNELNRSLLALLDENIANAHKGDQAIQHAHSFSVKAFETREELADLKKTNKSLLARMRKLEEQAEAAIKAKQIALQKVEAAEDIRKVAEAEKKEAEVQKAQAQKELHEALATKEADLKAADAQAYQQGMDDVAEDYKLQVMQACNKGYALGWNDLLKQLGLPADSPWRKTKAMRLPCPLPPAPTQAEEEAESEAEAEDEDEAEDEGEALVRKAKSPSKDEEILDLTGDEDLVAAPKRADIGTLSSDLLLAERSVDDTIAEIDAEVAADEAAEVIIEKEAEVVEGKEAEAEVAKDAEIILQEPSDVPAQSSVNV